MGLKLAQYDREVSLGIWERARRALGALEKMPGINYGELHLYEYPIQVHVPARQNSLYGSRSLSSIDDLKVRNAGQEQPIVGVPRLDTVGRGPYTVVVGEEHLRGVRQGLPDAPIDIAASLQEHSNILLEQPGTPSVEALTADIALGLEGKASTGIANWDTAYWHSSKVFRFVRINPIILEQAGFYPSLHLDAASA